MAERGKPGPDPSVPDVDPAASPLGEWSAQDADLLRSLFVDEAARYLREIEDAQEALDTGTASVDVEAVDALFRPLHTLKGAAGSVGFDAIARTAHELEELCAEMRAGQLAPTPGILERMGEAVGQLRALLEGARSAPLRSSPAEAENATDRRGPGNRRRALDRRLGEGALRVDSDRLDTLLEGVGDLVILRTRIERRLHELEGVLGDFKATRSSLRGALAAGVADAPVPASTSHLLDRLGEVEVELTDAVGYLERATKAVAGETQSLRRTADQLEEELRSARLVPLEWVYGRLASALRELERNTGLAAELVLEGGEIELDKAVVEQLADPLLHLLRNAFAHGIEPSEERLGAGKPARARINVSARQDGEFVFIRFDDDGRGVDRERARQALVRSGRLAPEASLPEELLVQALFQPGFSSRTTSDELAGRGMGLDIVRKAVLRLGGDVKLEYREGEYTHLRLAVPLTAAITQALLFKVGGQVYAVPAAHVVEALPLGTDEPPSGRGDRTAGLPVLRLAALLGAEAAPGRLGAALRIRYGERGFLVTCDKVIGPRTIVVRPLGPLLGQIPLYAGVTISGAGKAQLVLDLGALAEAALRPPRAATFPNRRGQPRVLVVDDSRLAREASALLLATAGYQPVTAEDGFDAWELLGERRFDAVVTDLEMPRLDGFDLIARIRAEPTLRGLPVLVLSSRTSQAMRQRARAVGANAILAKGPQKRGLADALAALLESPTRSRNVADP